MEYSTITITFGDQALTHIGMEKKGNIKNKGFNINELLDAKLKFEENNLECEFIKLNDYLPDKLKKSNNIKNAGVLIIRNGVNLLLKDTNKNADNMFNEQYKLDPDRKYYDTRRKKVLNKRARFNLCFGNIGQKSDFENKKGTIISYNDVPLTKKIRDELPKYLGNKANDLPSEGNYYFNINKCGIGFHGDAERKVVIAVRLGATIPLHYQWYTKNREIGKRIELNINHGDIYVMSEKATGYDWKKSSLVTLRHAAGADKFLRKK